LPAFFTLEGSLYDEFLEGRISLEPGATSQDVDKINEILVSLETSKLVTIVKKAALTE
jgi:hypothetical protein